MILSPCKSGKIDNVVFDVLKNVQSDIPIIPITRLEDFVFNDALLNLDRYIIADFVEYGWNWPMWSTHLFGHNTRAFDHLFDGDEWKKFDEFVRDRQPLLYFKRELLSRDVRKNILPIEYPAFNQIPQPQTKEQFEKRPLMFNFIWGLSHEYRKDLHGQIWQQAGKHNYIVCDNICFHVNDRGEMFHLLNLFFENEKHERKVLTSNVPWYARKEMKEIIIINELSKMSISISGAGRKCFRHTESPLNSVMVTWDDEIEWTYPWVHNVNCIKCEQGKEIDTIIEALNNPNLYEIYLAGVENCRKYELNNYIKNYIEVEINKL